MSGRIGARVGFVSAVVVLVLTGILGLRNALRLWPIVAGPLQFAAMCGVLSYGLLGLASAYAAMARRRWATWATTAWGGAILFVMVAGLNAFYPAVATALNLTVIIIAVALLTSLVLVGVRTAFDEGE